MVNQDATRIAIIGAGKGGTALLELFSRLPHIEIIGIADLSPQAPGLLRAQDLKIPVSHDADSLIADRRINLIVDVTGDPRMIDHLIRLKRPEVEVLGGAASKLLWDLLQHETEMQSQLFQSEKLASIGTFASGLAHDINNPLFLILGLAELQLEEDDPQKIRQHAQDIIQASKQISGICQDLTQYARESSTLHLVPVDLHTKIEEALRIAKHATNPHDLSIKKHFNRPLHILAKPEEVLQIFVNLLVNAIQAMDGQGTLTISSFCQDGKGKISITDTGSGIPHELLEKIFDPFFTTKPPGKGTGLGLHTVRAIVQKLHGELAVNSEVGKGTTFYVNLPLAVSS